MTKKERAIGIYRFEVQMAGTRSEVEGTTGNLSASGHSAQTVQIGHQDDDEHTDTAASTVQILQQTLQHFEQYLT